MIKASVTKIATFDCAHMLDGYNGACANLHGHTYKVEVSVKGDVCDGDMLVDFNKLSAVMHDTIIRVYDHAVLICATSFDPFERKLEEICREHNKKHVLIYQRPTAEYLAYLIREKIRTQFIHHDVSVKLWETPTSFVEV